MTSAAVLLILVICHSFPSSESLKTTVPTEVIEILKSEMYNKHQLPSKADLTSTVAKLKKSLEVGHWKLLIDMRHTNSGVIVKLVQKEDKSRIHRLSLSLRAAVDLSYTLTEILTDYRMNMSTQLDGAMTLISRKFHDDRDQYSLELSVNTVGLYIEIAQLNGAAWNVVSIPSSKAGEFLSHLQLLIRDVTQITKETPTIVTIGMYIEGMSSFRAQTMDFYLDIYFQETWIDYRLRHNSDKPVLVRDLSVFNLMWHPDLYFANAKEAKFHAVTSHNFLVWVYPDGTVYHDTRVSLVVNCMMDLTNYPLDSQECYIRILSYAYDSDNLEIRWKNMTPITINSIIMLPDMNLVNHSHGYCVGDYGDLGVWSCVMATFKMQREIMHHVLQTYIPTALIVIISWFSFWLDPESVPGRVSLCITTLLTLATQSSAARLSLPQVSYAKAIDIWMGASLGFVFGVMIEFTAVNYLHRRNQLYGQQRRSQAQLNNTQRCSSMPDTLHPTDKKTDEFNHLLFELHGVENNNRDCDGELLSNHVSLQLLSQLDRVKRRNLAVSIDRACRVLFPVAFALFNIVYWPFYLNRVTQHEFIAAKT